MLETETKFGGSKMNKSLEQQIGDRYSTVYKNGNIKLAICEIEFMNGDCKGKNFNARKLNVIQKLIGVKSLLVVVKEEDKQELSNYIKKLANDLLGDKK